MRITVAMDDELVAKAQACSRQKDKSVLVNEALKAFIAMESGRKFALLGGSEPDLTPLSRRA